MATNEPLNSAADEVAAAEAELKAAQEKLEAAKAKLAATTSDDACDVEKETVAAVVVDEATGEVEAVVDLVTEERKPLAKLAKDAAAGAVLLAAIMAVIAGLILFLPEGLEFLCMVLK